MNRKTTMLITVALTLLLAAWLSPAVQGQDMTMETATPMPQPTAAPATPAWSDDQLPLGSGMSGMPMGGAGMNMGGCPMMNGTMDGTMTGSMAMPGMGNMAGMNNMPGMAAMSGMGNMPGMAAMPDMATGIPLDNEGNIAWWYMNPWWLLGWGILALFVFGLFAGSLAGLVWLFQRFRPISREVRDEVTESKPA